MNVACIISLYIMTNSSIFSGKVNFVIYIRTSVCSLYIAYSFYSFNSSVDEDQGRFHDGHGLSLSVIYYLWLFQYAITNSILSLLWSLSIHGGYSHLSLYQPCIRNSSSLLNRCQHLLLLILLTIAILTGVRFQCK